MKLGKKAQAGMEYLMTYGWTLVLVISVFSVLAFVFGGTGNEVTFNSSDPAKIPVKAAKVTNTQGEVILVNATGGKVTVNQIDFAGAIIACETELEQKQETPGSEKVLHFVGVAAGSYLNGIEFTPGLDIIPPIEVTAGSDLHFTNICTDYTSQTGTITLHYTDNAGLQREAVLTARIPPST